MGMKRWRIEIWGLGGAGWELRGRRECNRKFFIDYIFEARQRSPLEIGNWGFVNLEGL